MPSSTNPSRELEETEEHRDGDDDPSRRDDDDELEPFDDELIVEEIQLDEVPAMEGPDA